MPTFKELDGSYPKGWKRIFWQHKPKYEVVAPLHGIASYEVVTDSYLTVLVPFNWIVSIALWSWSFLRFGLRHVVLDARNAYRQGYDDAMAEVKERWRRG